MARAPTLAALAVALAQARTSSRALTEACLARIEDPRGEGARAFVHVDREGALAQADAMDLLRAANAGPSAFAGIPISIKDLFDIAGQPTRAGSRVLAGAAPAVRDAVSVLRLRRAGFVLVGRTNMSEFAFSGVGLNPHYGTPAAAWSRGGPRIPGGSSSGAAVSVAEGMAHAPLGTDTGGSCRIPAAFNALVGFKPTARRVPLEGAVPLSGSLDSIGPLARSVACCAALDSILSAQEAPPPEPAALAGLRLAVPRNLVLDGMDAHVGRAFERALACLSAAGAALSDIRVPVFDAVSGINAKGGFPAAEAYAWHRELLRSKGADYDPRVRVRIERGAGQSAADYLDLLQARRRVIAEVEAAGAPYDAFVWPTVPVMPPLLSDLASEEDFARINLLVLRNPTLVNLFDGCAVSVPMHAQGEPPAGLMLAATAGQDRRLLSIAAAVEAVLGGPAGAGAEEAS